MSLYVSCRQGGDGMSLRVGNTGLKTATCLNKESVVQWWCCHILKFIRIKQPLLLSLKSPSPMKRTSFVTLSRRKDSCLRKEDEWLFQRSDRRPSIAIAADWRTHWREWTWLVWMVRHKMNLLFFYMISCHTSHCTVTVNSDGKFFFISLTIYILIKRKLQWAILCNNFEDKFKKLVRMVIQVDGNTLKSNRHLLTIWHDTRNNNYNKLFCATLETVYVQCNVLGFSVLQ